MKKTAIIILAAGKGSRMKSVLPKVLHKAMGKTLLEHVLASLPSALKKQELYCVVSKENQALVAKHLPENSVLCVQKKQLGTGDALRSVLPLLKKTKANTALVLPGDMPLLSQTTIKALIKTHQSKKHQLTVLTGKISHPKGYGRIIRDKSGNIEAIQEEKDLNPGENLIHEINTGVYLFDIPLLRHCLSKLSSQNAQKEFYLTDSVSIAKKYLKKKSSVGTFLLKNEEECLGVNSRKDLSNVIQRINQKKIQSLMDSGVTVVDPHSVWVDSTVKIGADTLLHPFTVISGNVVVGRSCEIGPFAHVHEQVQLKDHVCVGNFVEIKRSTLKEGTKAKHLSYLGDSILGKKVNVGAGTVTANYDGVKKHPTRIGDGCKVGSNTVIVAPNTLGAFSTTGAGTVVPANANLPPHSLSYGVPSKTIKNKLDKKLKIS